MGKGTLGRCFACVVVAAAGVACLVPAGAAAGAPPGACTDASVQIASTSQTQITQHGRIRVAVTGPADACSAKSKLRGATRAAGERPRQVTRVRRFPLHPTGVARTIGLRLTDAGRQRIARCQPQRLIVRLRIANERGRFAHGKRVVDRAQLQADSPACGGAPGSKRDYGLTPGAAARHTNGTPRDFAGTGTGPDQVRLELFACDNVTLAAGELVFAAAGGLAQRGAPAGSFSSIEGQATQGSPQQAGPLAASGGSLEFTLTGADGCAAPVLYRDANANSALDVDAQGVPTETYGGGGETSFEPQGAAFQNPGRCDPLDPAVCLQPFPTDHFTVADASTDTGKRLALNIASMPQSNLGVPISPAEHNRNDGFSPGSMLITKVPGLESPAAFEQTDPVPITDIARSYDEDAPIVVIDTATGERHLIWSELDANPLNPADVNLIIRPAVNFEEGHRYVVALRDLRDAAGVAIGAQRPFQLYRDHIVTSDPAVEARRPHFEQIFEELDEAGIERQGLYLAWDFTIASERNLSERALAIRDDAFAQLGDTNLADLQVQGQAPTFAVTGITNYNVCGNDGCGGGLPLDLPDLPISPFDLPIAGAILGPAADLVATLLGSAPEDDRIARKVEGQVLVPCYTNLPLCQTGSQFSYSGPTDTIPDRLPGNVTLANFTCLIPRSAVTGAVTPARPSLYGHGLLGSAGEVEAGNVKAMANEHNFLECATDWAGFATQDVPTVLTILQDLSQFPKLVDRTQQGLLNFMFLGRAMIHPQGFSVSPAFRFNGQSVIDTERLFYDGNSQGGILGGALAALAPDFDRAVLGVPGMNYSTLLRRSVDFEPYAEGEFVDGADLAVGLYDRYPNELERPLILALIQVLWDRAEANGYAHHMTTDPYANTPPHAVLLHVAFGDHQVSNWTAEVEARTIGAVTNPLPLDPGRHTDVDPLFGIPRIAAFPYDGSAIIYWDSGPPREGDTGVVAPPTTNTPPRPPEYGRDPHSDPRSTPAARIQKSEFLRANGKVVDVCDGHPCYAHGWTGAP